MLSLCRALAELPEVKKLRARIDGEGGTPVAVGGLSSAHKAHLIGALRLTTGRPAVVLCPDEEEALRCAADLGAWTGVRAAMFPVREWNLYRVEAVSREWEQARLHVLAGLQGGQIDLVCAPADAFLQRTLPPPALSSAVLTLRVGQTLPQGTLLAALEAGGYRLSEQVEGVGQYARRGGLVDFYAPGQRHPVRVDFFDDEIDALGAVDPDTQRRTDVLTSARLLPVCEALPQAAPGGREGLLTAMEALAAAAAEREREPAAGAGLAARIRADAERLRETGALPEADRYWGLLYPKMTTAFDFLPPDTLLFVSEHVRLRERLRAYAFREAQDIESLLAGGLLAPSQTALSLDEEDFWRRGAAFDTIFLDALPPGTFARAPQAVWQIPAKQLPAYGGSMDAAVADVERCRSEGFAVAVLCAAERQAARLKEILDDRGVTAALDFTPAVRPAPGQIVLSVGALSAGIEYPTLKLCVITEGQFLAAPRRRARGRAKDARARLSSYADLVPGDHVVHEHHGIGKFTGIVKMPVDGVERDYIHIAYAGADGLYVPVTQLHLVSKYIGAGEETAVRLNKLGGSEWHRAKLKAKTAAKDLAQGLIELYAARKRQPGFAFPPDSDWQAQFEASFEYVETEDQLRCTSEIKTDMQSAWPMDRLLCGDVGFGKTEVALRAVMKCVLGGKQAAMLVPTTVLAQQHHATALRRFGGYPVRIALCSRFVPPVKLRETMRRLATGEIDFIIGTHKLLQKSVVFKNLGILIVDEEQRFGVTHKERLKEMARQVDVLTLTATPIPRTLNMALSGIRDMSTIEEPPRDRYPVQTYVTEHDDVLVADALRREVQRGGQAYYLHNRVESIERTAARLAAQLPGVTVAAAHGQMSEERLSDIMNRMADGEIQVLVCTTIIETGIDIPNVNTLVIEDADRLGLAQLHQIRGRVGRSPRHAFAYLTYRRGRILSEVATKRLMAIREFAEFGSGFKIAMRDLEIRGAGNVLGSEQHGHLMNVGYDMYLKLLEEAVIEARGEETPAVTDCVADLAVPAGIPENYVSAPGQRMDLYRRIAAVRDEEDASDLLDEMLDRFGDAPEGVQALLQIALLRAEAARAGILEISQKGERLLCRMAAPDLRRVAHLCAAPDYRGRVLFGAGDSPHLSLRLRAPRAVLAEARAFVAAYRTAEEAP
ncbi:MAG: transcription-repair coupling factor [Oscillospiraceae bacterium]|jgi:transcription-repair coupling factor (superfamily II helicase)|nr:transcription-repair coupling factor [Oscillospiraceae bacterium]